MEYIIDIDNLEFVGAGGHGQVYKIKNAEIAIKRSKHERINLIKEGEILQSLQSVKYFPRLYLFSSELIVMEYIQGTPLSTWLMDGNEITDNIIQQINDAFKLCLLQGVYPVELEPDHIILNNGNIRIIDLGMYKRVELINNPIIIQFTLDKFKKRFLHWIYHWSNLEKIN